MLLNDFWGSIGQWFVNLRQSICDFFIKAPDGQSMSPGQRIFLGIFVFIIFYIIIHYLFKFIKKVSHVNEIKSKRKIKSYNSKTKKFEDKYITEDNTLKKFIINSAAGIIKIILLIICLNLMGFDLSGVATIISSALLAIGLALQDSIKNFVAGLMILSQKSILLGDYVEIQELGIEGSVVEIRMMTTVLDTFRNQRIFIPNNFLTNNSLKNYNKNKTRRADINFSVAYGQDIDNIKKLMLGLSENDKRIVSGNPNKAKSCTLGEITPYSINFTLKMWVKNDDYWNVIYEYNEKVAKTLYENKIIPGIQTYKIANQKNDFSSSDGIDVRRYEAADKLETLELENDKLREELEEAKAGEKKEKWY